MIPIIYESGETAFTSNGLGRLQSCIDGACTEERNGIYEVDFSYPVDGENFDLIQCGRIITVTHDESGDTQPFDIVSFTRPINGVVTFHAEHISYRQRKMTATGTGVNSLAAAFDLLETAQPSNPFMYSADFESTGYMAAADGVPRSVRQLLGGIEGSILDAYGGEYEFDKFRVILHSSRGQLRDFSIRYGVNLLDYKEDTDYGGTFSSCVPYWKGNENGSDVIVIGDRVDTTGPTYNGRNDCIPLDLTEKFEDKPTKAQLQSLALTLMQSRQTNLPAQNISVDFLRLQDMGYEGLDDLLQCNLCDSIKVEFPRYGMSGTYKIVKTVWNFLEDRYESMELGALSTTLAEALGITSGGGGSVSGGGGSVSIDAIYPVGSIYLSANNVNPSTYLDGTTWVQLKDRFLLGAGDTYTAGAKDGAATVKLTGAQSGVHQHTHSFTQPSVTGGSHSHYINYHSKTLAKGTAYDRPASIGSGTANGYTTSSTSHTHTVSGGAVGNTTVADATEAHNNMPPYLVVYMWQRTA